MTEREFRKYNNPNAFDAKGKLIKPGDTVVVNNHYGRTPYVGVADHFTEGGNVAVLYDWVGHGGYTYKCWAYRHPNTMIKLRSGRKKK